MVSQRRYRPGYLPGKTPLKSMEWLKSADSNHKTESLIADLDTGIILGANAEAERLTLRGTEVKSWAGTSVL